MPEDVHHQHQHHQGLVVVQAGLAPSPSPTWFLSGVSQSTLGMKEPSGDVYEETNGSMLPSVEHPSLVPAPQQVHPEVEAAGGRTPQHSHEAEGAEAPRAQERQEAQRQLQQQIRPAEELRPDAVLGHLAAVSAFPFGDRPFSAWRISAATYHLEPFSHFPTARLSGEPRVGNPVPAVDLGDAIRVQPQGLPVQPPKQRLAVQNLAQERAGICNKSADKMALAMFFFFFFIFLTLSL